MGYKEAIDGFTWAHVVMNVCVGVCASSCGLVLAANDHKTFFAPLEKAKWGQRKTIGCQ